MVGVSEEEIIAYVLGKVGCLHPFRLSRIIALAEMEWLREKGERLTGFTYVRGPGTFFIDELKDIIDKNEDCFEKREGDPVKGVKGCILYKCTIPQIPPEIERVVDRAIKEASEKDNMELNRLVMEDPLFKEISRPMDL